MKFKNGTWFLKEGISLVFPHQIRAYDIEETRVTCYAPCREIETRADTINGPMLTYTFSSPMPNVIKVNAVHFKGTRPFDHDFAFLSKKEVVLDVKDLEDEIVVRSGKTNVVINKKGPIHYTFYYEEKRLTKSDIKSACYAIDQNGKNHMCEQLDLDVGECVYGLGERFGPLVKNGQALDMWNADAGTNSDLAYKNVPFYLTDRNYGVFVNHTGRVSYEICTQRVDKVQFSVPDEGLE